MAAYRFFGNEEVQWQDVLVPHIKCSQIRMAAHEVVLCIQDTTELDFNGQTASGFLARTGDGEPGVKTIWLGMQRILDFAAGIRFSRELRAQGTCV